VDVEVDEKYERRRGTSLPTSSILKNMIQYFETISNKLHFDFQFLEIRHDNPKLFPDYTMANLSNLDSNVLVDSACTTTLGPADCSTN